LFFEELLKYVHTSQAVLSWKGPLKDSVDFVIGGIGVEVKTSAGLRPLKVRISNEKQLSDEGLDLLVLNCYELTSRQDGVGQTLNEIIERIRSQLMANDLANFNDLLISGGYAEIHRGRYERTQYTVIQNSKFTVSGEFPRIISSNLSRGLGNVSYDLFLDVCENFRITDGELRKCIGNYE
jgi:hypothetical protein